MTQSIQLTLAERESIKPILIELEKYTFAANQLAALFAKQHAVETKPWKLSPDGNCLYFEKDKSPDEVENVL